MTRGALDEIPSFELPMFLAVARGTPKTQRPPELRQETDAGLLRSKMTLKFKSGLGEVVGDLEGHVHALSSAVFRNGVYEPGLTSPPQGPPEPEAIG
jgi:hypothetical protein